MTNLLAKLSNTTRDPRVLLTVAVISVQVVLSGCGIPDLRCATPGPVMPGQFDDANNLIYFQENPNPEAYMEQSQAESEPGENLPASFTETAGDEGAYDEDVETDTQVGEEDPGFDEAGFDLFDVPPDLFDEFPDADREEIDAEVTAAFAEAAVFDQDDETAAPQEEAANQDAAATEAEETPTETSANTDAADATDAAAADDSSDDYGIIPAPDNVGDMTPNKSGFVEVGPTGWENSATVPWFQFFDDPALAGLIDQALVGNQELKMLGEEIRVAGFEVMARRGAYLPFVTVGGGAGIDKPGQFTRIGAVEDQLDIRPGKAFPEPLPDFLASADVSWQIDIWRQLRNARDSAILHYLGTQEGQVYVVTRLAAEIAENYYELMALDNRLVILDQTIQIQKRSRQFAEANLAAGRGTALAVQRFQADVRKHQSEKLVIHQRIIEVENRINFLVGRYPQHVERDSVGYMDMNLHTLNVGVPSQLLQNRPDIRQAERELASAGLAVKVARARFYPSVFITGGVGLNAFNPRYLFTTPESLIYGVAGEIVSPLINKKAIRADYLSANALQLKSLYNYQRTILNAFTEVINRVAKVENYAESIQIKKQQLEALEASVNIATNLFQTARAEYVDVLLAQRDLMEARMVLVETKQQQLSAIINAYQALGGGGTRMYYEPQ